MLGGSGDAMPGANPSDGAADGVGSTPPIFSGSTGKSGTSGAAASAPHGQCDCPAAGWSDAFLIAMVWVAIGSVGSEQMRTVIDPDASLSIIQPGATNTRAANAKISGNSKRPGRRK